MFAHELFLEEKSVRGTMVTGLVERDIRALDMFEGDVSAPDVIHFPALD
jgi:hypothetical protein